MDEIDEEKGLYFAEFSNQLMLKEIIVGAMSDITRAEISQCLGDIEDNVTTFKSRLAFRTFRVVKQRKEELWV